MLMQCGTITADQNISLVHITFMWNIVDQWDYTELETKSEWQSVLLLIDCHSHYA